MIKVHHLNYSRSHRIIWLMEELGAPYEIVQYKRGPDMRAPASLAALHPLGKAPVIEDGDLVLAESGAIIEYIGAKYGKAPIAPGQDSPAWPHYIEWLHYAEGSAALPLMIQILTGMMGVQSDALQAFVGPEVAKTFDYIRDRLGDRPYLLSEFSGADIQMSFVVMFAKSLGRLGDYPSLQRYLERLEDRPAYKRAIEIGGPVSMPMPD